MRTLKVLLMMAAAATMTAGAQSPWRSASSAPESPGTSSPLKEKVSTQTFKAPAAHADEETFTVTCLPVTRDQWSAWEVIAYQDGFKRFDIDGAEMKLPAGTYDFVAVFEHFPIGSYRRDYLGLVVRESVTVDKDMTLEFDPATATNHIKFNPLLDNGETISLPKVSYDSNWNKTVIEEGNISAAELTVTYILGTKKWYYQVAYTMAPEISESLDGSYDPTTKLNLYTNELSDRLNIGFSCIITGRDVNDPTYVICAEQKGSAPGTISNNTNKYIDTYLKTVWTPKGTNTLNNIAQNSLQISPYGVSLFSFGGFDLQSWMGLGQSTSSSHHIMYCPGNGDNSYYNYIIAPTTTEVFKVGSDFMGSTNLGGYRLFSSYGQEIVCNPNTLLPTAYSARTPYRLSLPGCGSFTAYNADNMEVNFATAPALFSILDCIVMKDDNSLKPEFNMAYTGRLGEIRNTDLSFMEFTAKQNGSPIAENYQELQTWLTQNATSLSGNLEISIKDNNCKVADETASNNATVTVNLSNDDYFPPTLTMLQFRDDENHITSTFENGEIHLSAADINFSAETTRQYVVESPAYVICEIAPSGTENFKPLELSRHTEFYDSDVLGANYSAPLTYDTGTNGWFDVRITVADIAGNTQVQTIGRAFNINKADSIEDIELSGNKEIVNIYTFDGIEISPSQAKSGIYIVRYSNGRTAKVRL